MSLQLHAIGSLWRFIDSRIPDGTLSPKARWKGPTTPWFPSQPMCAGMVIYFTFVPPTGAQKTSPVPCPLSLSSSLPPSRSLSLSVLFPGQSTLVLHSVGCKWMCCCTWAPQVANNTNDSSRHRHNFSAASLRCLPSEAGRCAQRAKRRRHAEHCTAAGFAGKLCPTH